MCTTQSGGSPTHGEGCGTACGTSGEGVGGGSLELGDEKKVTDMECPGWEMRLQRFVECARARFV